MGEQVFSEPTQPLLHSSRPHGSVDPEFSDSSDVAVDKAIADQSTLQNALPAGLDAVSRQGMLQPTAGAGGYIGSPPGEPQWPLPQTGPKKRVAVAAVVGLPMAIITVIIVAALVGNSLLAALGSPSRTSSRVVSASPTVQSQQAVVASPSAQSQQAVAGLPTATRVPTAASSSQPTTTPLAPTSWLVVAPTTVALDCHSATSVMIQLSNTGPEAVSWAAQTTSTHQSGVAVEPASGSLPAGGTQAITLSVSSGNSTGSQGTILFAVVSGQQATHPAQVSYTTTGCGGD
jgi:hypothetical protein